MVMSEEKFQRKVLGTTIGFVALPPDVRKGYAFPVRVS
jgi:hypothetical protein